MVRVGIIDSGCSAAELSCAVAFDADGQLIEAVPDSVGHGTDIASIIRRDCDMATLIHAQVMIDRPVTSPLRVAAALDWFTNLGGNPRADVVCMSFGVANDREVLRQAVQSATGAGLILVASVPARRFSGSKCYPGDYAGVIAATGDARCGWQQVSVLGRCLFGAWSNSPERGGLGAAGASVAAARLTAMVAANCLVAGRKVNREEVLSYLKKVACFKGAEIRV